MVHKFTTFILLCTVFTYGFTWPPSAVMSGSPIILIPGDGGSQIEMKLTNEYRSPHFWCPSTTKGYEQYWFVLHRMFPAIRQCTVDVLKLNVDQDGRASNTPGVLSREPGWGDTHTVEYFDSIKLSQTKYFNKIAEKLLNSGNYVRNISLRGAPFDFRLLPNDGNLLSRLRELIENTFDINNSRRIVIIAHSYGNIVAHQLLQFMPQDWKDKYVRAFVALAAPVAGAMKTVRMLATGAPLGIPLMQPNLIRQAQRTFPSSAMLMPYYPFWNSTEVIAYTDTRSYTINDMKDFFKDINFPIGWKMRKIAEMYDPTKPPGVETHCINGHGIPTESSYDWRGKKFPDDTPKEIMGDGDGTVNIRSLRLCLQWRHQQLADVHHTELKNVGHLDILQNGDVIDYVFNLATSADNTLL